MSDGFDVSRRGLLGLTLSAAAIAGPALGQVVSPSIAAGFKGLDAGKGVTAYKGIPYAKPPVGALRFAAPQRLSPPSGKQIWTKFGPPAFQNPTPSSVKPTSELGKALQTIFPTAAEVAAQSEDCLYLNVWTNARQPETGRPVMVWLHGGGFATGSGAWPIYDGASLATQDVVVVTLNHRLNVFGYADLPGAPGSGNAGMLDIVAALHWVKDNIHLFGGDPCNVTIFGESGGGRRSATCWRCPRPGVCSTAQLLKAARASRLCPGRALRPSPLISMQRWTSSPATSPPCAPFPPTDSPRPVRPRKPGSPAPALTVAASPP